MVTHNKIYYYYFCFFLTRTYVVLIKAKQVSNLVPCPKIVSSFISSKSALFSSYLGTTLRFRTSASSLFKTYRSPQRSTAPRNLWATRLNGPTRIVVKFFYSFVKRRIIYYVPRYTFVKCGNQIPQLIATFLAVYEPPQSVSSESNIRWRPSIFQPKSYSGGDIEPRRERHQLQIEHHIVYDTNAISKRSICCSATGSSCWRNPQLQIQSRFATLTWWHRYLGSIEPVSLDCCNYWTGLSSTGRCGSRWQSSHWIHRARIRCGWYIANARGGRSGSRINGTSAP